GLDVGRVRRDHLIADREARRGQDVRLLAIEELDEREAGRAVRIVLDADHGRRHAGLGPLEVDLAVPLLVTLRTEPRGDPAVVVATGLRRLVLEKALLGLALGDLAEVLRGHATTAGRGGLVKTNRHGLDALEELDVVAGLQRHERLLPRRTLTREATDALLLAAHDERADIGHRDLEQLLHRAAHVDLVRVAS